MKGRTMTKIYPDSENVADIVSADVSEIISERNPVPEMEDWECPIAITVKDGKYYATIVRAQEAQDILQEELWVPFTDTYWIGVFDDIQEQVEYVIESFDE